MLKIGHRGAPTVAPENTLASFRRAFVAGADAIELDLHRCKSGELIIIHDETVDRTTDGKGAVAELTLADICKLHVSGGEHVPTLPEALERFGRLPHYFLECKSADAVTQTAELITHHEAHGWPKGRLVLITFLLHPLQNALKVFPTLTAGASFEEWPGDAVHRAKALGARYLLPHFADVTATRLKEAHDAGLKVVTWTVNEAAEIARLAGMGIDGIISDYPERLNNFPLP